MRAREFVTEQLKMDTYIHYVVKDNLKNNCKDSLWMFENGTPIWRSLGWQEYDRLRNPKVTGAIVDPTVSTRVSTSTSNHYTQIFDSIPSMSAFPKRQNSIIATTSHNRSEALFWREDLTIAIIPFDGVKIGCTNTPDIWNIEVTLGSQTASVKDINDVFQKLGVPDSSYNDIIRYISDPPNDEVRQQIESTFSITCEELAKQIPEAYSPQNTGMTLHTSATLSSVMVHEEEGNELWIGGPCVYLTRKNFVKMTPFMGVQPSHDIEIYDPESEEWKEREAYSIYKNKLK